MWVLAYLLELEFSGRDLRFASLPGQKEIERVYYSHQIGATKPFEEAVPRPVLEAKVRTYLKESVALEKSWSTPVINSERVRLVILTRAEVRIFGGGEIGN